MSEFSVNTDKISSIADLLEQQAKELESARSSVDSIKNNLRIEGSVKAQVMSAMKTASDNVREESSAVVRMGNALRQIAASYRSTENSILGRLSENARHSGADATGVGGEMSGTESGTQNGNNKNSGTYSKDPVNLNTGNFILDNHDMEIPGFEPLRLGRFYNSMGTFEGMLGKDWNTSFEMKLSLSSNHYLSRDDVCVMLVDGREEYFVSVDGKNYLPVSGSTSELVRNGDGYIYETLEGDYYHFDENGKYIRFENAHHVGFNLIYNENVLQRVEKDSGEFFAFSYNKRGFLEAVEDHTGRICQYVFADGHLKQVILPDGSAYQYFYNQYGKISRVLNPRRIDAVETEYDELYRVVYQRFADGTTNKFDYLDSEQAVIMTERNGSKSIHYHNEKYQNVRNVYSDGEECFEYNERGQKTVIVDKLGNVTRLQYDNRGNLTNILTADRTKISATYNQQNRLLSLSVNGKNKVRNQYNMFGDLLSTEDALGRKTTYIYDEYGKTTQIGMPDGTEINAVYDERGNLSNVKSVNGGVFGFVYDDRNQMIGQTDAMGKRKSYAYDIMGRLLSETREDGRSKYYVYDEWGNIVSVKDYDGSVTTGVYNENNKLTAVTDAVGRTTRFEYDSMWNITKAILPNGSVFRYLYDENNRLGTICDAEGNQTHYKYDSMGNILVQTNAEGADINYVWDSNGRCVKVLDADGAATEYKYDEEDRVIYVKDAEGIELFRTFDAVGQLIEERDSLGRNRNFAYNEMGDMVSTIDERGHKTCYEYAKGLHKPVRILHPDGTEEQYSYDLCGNVESYTNIYGMTLRYQYDEMNRLTSITGEHGHIAEYGYDLLNRVIWEKNIEGNITRYEYSITGQLASVVDALGNTTHYSYDDMDELIGVLKEIPDLDQPVRIIYERDLMGRITKITDPLGKTESYRYNCLGKIVEKIDRENQKTQYFYNKAGLLQMIKWADGKEARYQYSPLRRLNEISDWTGLTRIEYDGQGNPLQITYPDQRTMTLEYDAQGNRKQMRYPDGRLVTYEYDSLDRLEKITNDDFSVTYAYNPIGEISSRKLSDGTNIQYQYNRQGLLEKMICSDDIGILDAFTFGYDDFGRKQKYGIYRRDYPQDNGNYEYSYDSIGRLQKVTRDCQVLRTYSYDTLGNRSSMTNFDRQIKSPEVTKYEYDLRGGILKSVRPGLTEEYKYDQRGNLTKVFRNGRIYKQYHYDALNRLASSQSEGGERADYQYNGLGYRIGMNTVQNGQEKSVSYILDYSRIYDNLLEKRENQEMESYIWGNGLEGFAEKHGSGWYLADSLGSILRKTKESKAVFVENYDEFGNISYEYGNNSELFGYNGFMFDSVAGTYFAQARQYRSYTGTFDAMDRFGGDITMPDTLNPYCYCVNDPFNHTDKSGYWFGLDDAIAAGIGAIGGVGGQFISDVIDGATTGNWDFSWQEYTGAAIGGAAGGVTTLYAGPIAGGAVSGGVSRLTTEGLTWASNPKEYAKSGWDVAKETALDTGMGALSGAVSKLTGKATEKLAQSKAAQWLVSKMKNGGKLMNKVADHIVDIAHGKSSKQWSQITKFLKNQYETIAQSPALKRKLYSLLLTGIPAYVGQELWGKIISKVTPSKVLWDKLKKEINKQLKELLGLEDSETTCAAGSGGW